MSTPAAGPTGGNDPRERRERISCPGCGRHDWVRWPQGQETYAWKCFNCEKRFELSRGGRH